MIGRTHFAAITDSVQARVQCGAPPLRTLAIDDGRCYESESDEVTEKAMIDLMKRESPSTSVVLFTDYSKIFRLFFGFNGWTRG